MNDLDRQIILFFESHGYQSAKALAAGIGVSERTVRRHIKEMIGQDIFRIVMMPNPMSCGFKAWTKIGIKVEPPFLNSVANKLVEHPAVYFVAYSLGRFDIIIAAHFDAIAELAYFLNSELAGFPGVVNSEPWMLASPRKYYGFSWPAGKSVQSIARSDNEESSIQKNNQIIGKNDRDIISLLWTDGLASLTTIESRLDLADSTIRKRMTYMLDNNICRREVVLNPAVLENETWATIGISTGNRDANEVVDALIKHQAIYLASISFGKFNILISTRFRNLEQLNNFVIVELPSVYGIASTETFVHNNPLKYHNIVTSSFKPMNNLPLR